MAQDEADALWPVVHVFNTPVYEPIPKWDRRAKESADTLLRDDYQPEITGKPNVIVIILESFSAVYSGRLAGGDGYMPFLDS
jgi:phosphoglycerol transferase MdoB-like AlkP superfamily enzyme